MSNKPDNNDFLHGFSANEKALLEGIPTLILRKIVARIFRFKFRMQFTGWLQYLIPVIFLLMSSLIGGLAQLLNARYISIPFLAMGSVLFIITLYDLITSKYRLRFPEGIPQRKENLDIFELMQDRRSCRSFQTKKMTKEDHDELMESIRMRTGEDQTDDLSIRFEYLSAALTVWPVVNATEFIVAIAPKQYDRSAVRAIGRCLQKIVVDATRMGIASCWIGPGADQHNIIQELGERFNPDKDSIICLCAVGYESRYIPLFLRIFNAMMRRRLPLSELFFTVEELERPLISGWTQTPRWKRISECCRWAPSSYNGQTTRGVANLDDGGNLKRLDFYTTTASRYYAPIALGIWCANWELSCEAQGNKGYFTIVPAEDRTRKHEEENNILSHYDVSWMSLPDQKMHP